MMFVGNITSPPAVGSAACKMPGASFNLTSTSTYVSTSRSGSVAGPWSEPRLVRGMENWPDRPLAGGIPDPYHWRCSCGNPGYVWEHSRVTASPPPPPPTSPPPSTASPAHPMHARGLRPRGSRPFTVSELQAGVPSQRNSFRCDAAEPLLEGHEDQGAHRALEGRRWLGRGVDRGIDRAPVRLGKRLCHRLRRQRWLPEPRGPSFVVGRPRGAPADPHAEQSGGALHKGGVRLVKGRAPLDPRDRAGRVGCFGLAGASRPCMLECMR